MKILLWTLLAVSALCFAFNVVCVFAINALACKGCFDSMASIAESKKRIKELDNWRSSVREKLKGLRKED